MTNYLSVSVYLSLSIYRASVWYCEASVQHVFRMWYTRCLLTFSLSFFYSLRLSHSLLHSDHAADHMG